VQDGVTEGDSIAWPVHFLQIHRDTASTAPLIFSYSNLEDPGVSGLDTALAVDLDGDGSTELFVVNRIYGTGAAFEECALTVEAGAIRCWSGPEFPAQDKVLQAGEVLMKGWGRDLGGPGVNREEAGPQFAPGKSLWYRNSVYHTGDPNCCPSANATLWVQAIPRNGHFETGLWLRTTEESTEAIIRIDTLRH
jgi:hypothetical protein